MQHLLLYSVKMLFRTAFPKVCSVKKIQKKKNCWFLLNLNLLYLIIV